MLDTLQGEDGIWRECVPGDPRRNDNHLAERQHAARVACGAGSHYVAAPVAGRPDAAAAEAVHIWGEGGNQSARAGHRSAYAADDRGRDPASAASIKLVETSLWRHIELVGEAFVFAQERRAGAVQQPDEEPALMREYMEIETRNYGDAGFTLDAGLKDVGLILDAAAERACGYGLATSCASGYLRRPRNE